MSVSSGISHGKVWQVGALVSEKHTGSIFRVEVKMKSVVVYNLGNPYQTSRYRNLQDDDMIILEISSQWENTMKIEL